MNRVAAFILATALPSIAGAGDLVDHTFAQGRWVVPVSPLTAVSGVYGLRDGSSIVILRDELGNGLAEFRKLSAQGVVDSAFGAGAAALPKVGVRVIQYNVLRDLELRLGAVIGEDAQGRIYLDTGSTGNLDPEPDGSHLLLLMARLSPAGAPDGSFGQGDLKIRTAAVPDGERCRGAIRASRIFPDGDGLLVAGTRGDGIFADDGFGYARVVKVWSCAIVARLTASGQLDTSFGTGGFVQTSVLDQAETHTVMREADGSLVLTGMANTGQLGMQESPMPRPFRWKVTAAGVPVGAAEAGDRLAQPPFGGGSAGPDGLGGSVRLVKTGTLTYLYLYEGMGPKAGFGQDGMITIPFMPRTYFEFAGRTAEGGAYVVGGTQRTENGIAADHLLFCRFLANGAADQSLGTNGCAEASVGGFISASPKSAKMLADGSLMVSVSNEGIFPNEVPRSARRQVLVRLNATPDVIEYHNTILDHYFLTYDGAEAAGIDAGVAGPGWERTGARFTSGGTTAACRFYGTPGVGPNSHFYTLDAAECASVKQSFGWTYEGLGFYATPLQGGGCPSELVTVYRVYNQRAAQNDSNHRYLRDLSLLAPLQARGWALEGPTLCARP